MKILINLWIFLFLVSCSDYSDKHREGETFDDTEQTKISKIIAIEEENKIATNKQKAFVLKDIMLDDWLAISETQTKVEQKFGPAEKREEVYFCEATAMFVQVWIYESLGLVFEMESELKGEEMQVRSIRLTKGSLYTISSGIGINSELELIRAKYADVIDTKFSDDSHIVVGSVYEGLVFTIENNRVIEIFIGALAE